ncbi:MAG: hypothetical protein ABJJ69_08930 [Paracoccaceae bacterium]
MNLIADILLAAGAIGAGFYCFVLGRRLKRFNNLENGVGGAVAVLSSQVEDLKATLDQAQTTASTSAKTLETLHDRAEDVSKRLEIQMAALHDLPDATFPEAQDSPVQHVPDKKQPSELMFVRHSVGEN